MTRSREKLHDGADGDWSPSRRLIVVTAVLVALPPLLAVIELVRWLLG